MGDLRANFFNDFHGSTEWEDFEQNDFNERAIYPNFNSESEILPKAEQIHEFLKLTPELTASEQAELLGAVVENARRPSSRGGRQGAGGRRSGGTDWGRIARGVQTGLNMFQQGAQIAGGLAGTFGGNNQTARDFFLWANRLGQGAGQVGGMLQAFRGGQIPSLPTTVGGSVVAPGVLQQPTIPAQTPVASPPSGYMTPTTPTGAGAIRGTGLNATALMGLLLSNPQLMQAIRSAPFLQQAGTPRVEVDIPNSESVEIPLGAVMETIARLAQASTLELNAMTSEDDTEIPEYLVGEDGEFLVDPVSAEDRAALVLHLLRLQGEVERYADSGGFSAFNEMGEDDMDESDVWAREAGFDD